MQLAKWWGVHLAPGLRNAPTSSFFFVSTLMTGTLSAAQRSRSSVMCRNWSSRLGWEAAASFLVTPGARVDQVVGALDGAGLPRVEND